MPWGVFAEGIGESAIAAFAEAKKDVLSQTDSVDERLDTGELCCPDCAWAIENMTGRSIWSDWTAADVVARFSSASIPPNVDAKDLWAYLSAWHFLRICADGGFTLRVTQ